MYICAVLSRLNGSFFRKRSVLVVRVVFPGCARDGFRVRAGPVVQGAVLFPHRSFVHPGERMGSWYLGCMNSETLHTCFRNTAIESTGVGITRQGLKDIFLVEATHT
jgi:hypothetical protein